MKTSISRFLISGFLYCLTGCGSEASNESPATDTANIPSSPPAAASSAGLQTNIPEQGGGVIVIGDTSYPVVADWSCNFIPYAKVLGATGHGVDDEHLEFAFDLSLLPNGGIAGQITLKLTEQDIRWETADAGGDETVSGITEAELTEDGGFGHAMFRQRGSGDWEGSSEFAQGSFDIRCPKK